MRLPHLTVLTALCIGLLGAAPCLADDGAAEADSFRSRWPSFPDKPFEITPEDFKLYGRWGRLIPYRLTQNYIESLEPHPEHTEGWNPFKNLDAYTYGAYAIWHEKLLHILPGVRMEFNNIAEGLILCLDIAGPGGYMWYGEDVELGSTITTESGYELSWAVHATFSTHLYLLGQIQGPYFGPVVGFHSFHYRGVGFFGFPLVGADVGFRLSLGSWTANFGAMAYGMALKHVHPDFGFEFYGGIGMLI
jgi:hypothetical protein